MSVPHSTMAQEENAMGRLAAEESEDPTRTPCITESLRRARIVRRTVARGQKNYPLAFLLSTQLRLNQKYSRVTDRTMPSRSVWVNERGPDAGCRVTRTSGKTGRSELPRAFRNGQVKKEKHKTKIYFCAVEGMEHGKTAKKFLHDRTVEW